MFNIEFWKVFETSVTKATVGLQMDQFVLRCTLSVISIKMNKAAEIAREDRK